MRNRIGWCLLMVGLTVALTACGEKPLLKDVSFDRERITPNADGHEDVLKITYDLNRSADVSITFEDQERIVYTFRDRVHRGPSVEEPYAVLFSGVVDGYTLTGESFAGFDIERRVLRDGTYVWQVEAEDETGHTEQVTGTLVVEEADTALPELRNLSVSPPVFTPNRDGISDRAKINVALSK
ncbi:MAG: hypothetical protein ACOC8C_01870, partial [Chloroflexota bacterium]